jgi:hypothetical protein
MGPLLVASHPMVQFLFVSLRMVESIEIHSGYPRTMKSIVVREKTFATKELV